MAMSRKMFFIDYGMQRLACDPRNTIGELVMSMVLFTPSEHEDAYEMFPHTREEVIAIDMQYALEQDRQFESQRVPF